MFARGVLNPEAEFAVTAARGQVQVRPCACAEVEDALPGGTAVPVDPGGDRDVLGVGDAGLQRHEVVHAVQVDRRTDISPSGKFGGSNRASIEVITRTVGDIPAHLEICHQLGTRRQRRDGDLGGIGAFAELIVGADDIIIGRTYLGFGIAELCRIAVACIDVPPNDVGSAGSGGALDSIASHARNAADGVQQEVDLKPVDKAGVHGRR